jgi:hypothetical protein
VKEGIATDDNEKLEPYRENALTDAKVEAKLNDGRARDETIEDEKEQLGLSKRTKRQNSSRRLQKEREKRKWWRLYFGTIYELAATMWYNMRNEWVIQNQLFGEQSVAKHPKQLVEPSRTQF